jgi:hypothetical protein
MRNGIRLLSLGAAVWIEAAAWRSSFCRNQEGDLNGHFVLALALAAACVLFGFTMGTIWSGFGRWLALALVGQAAALQLIDAGTRIHFQHYRLPLEALADPILRWAIMVVALQTLAVLAGIVAHASTIGRWMRRPGHAVRVAAVLIVSGCAGAAVSRDQRFFVLELSFAAFIQLVNAANILFLAWSIPQDRLKSLSLRFDSWLGGRETRRGTLDRFAVLAALWVTILSAGLSWGVYQRHPHVADEVAYLYNARYFAAGKVVMAPPPVVAAFNVDLMDYQPDKWFSAVPLGWPAVLTAGAAVGIPWLVNPILAGCNVLLVYLLLTEIYSLRIARIAVLLLCASPWNAFLAMSFMTHTVTMTFALLAFLGVARARRNGSTAWALLAGAAVGAGSLVRPLDGLIVGVLAGAWAVGFGGTRLKLRGLVALAASTVLVGALVLPYNKALTGDPTASPLISYLDKQYGPKSNEYGFGPERGMGWPTDAYPGHTPFEALINAQLNGASLNTDLFGWGTGSICLLAALLFSGALRRPDYLMLAAIAIVLFAYAPYWGNGGPDFGARYWYLILVPCVALSARGLEWLESFSGVRATAAVAVLCGLALFNYLPWRSLDKYHHYLRMRPDVRTLSQERSFGRSLVLVRGERFPDYASAAIYNPLDLTSDAPVFVWDQDASVRAKILSVYPDRPTWIVEGPSITHAGYRVAAGPLPAGSGL